ncbi:MAG: hypothetical protein R3195_12595 [Gemmatimonadota bacterium]|nr:hypothetical protein [Gemmatimonadota bacterium]
MGRTIRALTLLVLTASACTDDPLGPFQPEVTNAPDSFQLQATDVTGVTSTLTYTWSNSGIVANVDHSTTTTDGTARLIVRASDGTQVYDEELVASRNEPTEAGPAGDWTIQLVLTRYSGTLNFRLQTP